MTTVFPSPVCGMPQAACASSAASRALSQSGATVRFRKPGPATSTFANVGSPASAAATFAPISRGFACSFFATFSASLHW